MTAPPGHPVPETRLPQAPVAAEVRERAVELLKRAYANDALAETEFEARLDLAYRALTGAELDAVVADLTLPSPTSDPATRTGGTRIVARFSGHEARMTEVVPRQLQLRARLGYIELDLTGATFEPGLTTIDVRAFMGYIQIRFPSGVRVENSGRALLGFFSLGGGPAEDAPQAHSVVRLTGRALLGFAECFIAPPRRETASARPADAAERGA